MLEELNNKLNEIDKEIFDLKKTLFQIDYLKYSESASKIIDKLEELNRQKELINGKILLLSRPLISDDLFDIRLKEGYKNYYEIYLHGTLTKIGIIEYRKKDTMTIKGNVGYFIKEEYRGKNYAYHAVSIFLESLYNEGIEVVWISSYDYNIASIKTIEKLGGVLEAIVENIYIYKCFTLKAENKKLSVVQY